MEYASHAVTPRSPEAESDQESDTCASDTENPTALCQHNSPTLALDSGTSGQRECVRDETTDGTSAQRKDVQEETKDAQVALDVKEEGSLSGSLQSQDGVIVSQPSEQDAVPPKVKEKNTYTNSPNRQNQNASKLDVEKGVNGGHTGPFGDEGECRVCHLGGIAGETETINLGCDCKSDLSFAHRHCAEAWFKIKGNRSCEICGATAQNVVGIEDTSFMDRWNDGDAGGSAMDEPRRCWQSQAICNFILACMVVAFMLPWLFHVAAF
eukprot:c22999_g2_i1 orf=272-1072(+)